jgi:hypothetical protein
LLTPFLTFLQIHLFAQRRLANALVYKTCGEESFAQLAALKLLSIQHSPETPSFERAGVESSRSLLSKTGRKPMSRVISGRNMAAEAEQIESAADTLCRGMTFVCK